MASLPWALPPQHDCHGIAAMFIAPVGVAAVGTTVGIATVVSLPWDIVDVTSVAIAAVALPPCLRPRGVSPQQWHHCCGHCHHWPGHRSHCCCGRPRHGVTAMGVATVAMPLQAPLLCTSPLWGYFHVGIATVALQLWHCHCQLCCCEHHCLGITATAHGHCCRDILATGTRCQGFGHCWWLRATTSPPSLREVTAVLWLCPAWHPLAPPCLGARDIPKGGAPGPWVPLSVGTGTALAQPCPWPPQLQQEVVCAFPGAFC